MTFKGNGKKGSFQSTEINIITGTLGDVFKIGIRWYTDEITVAIDVGDFKTEGVG